MHCLFKKKKNRALSVQLCKPAVFFEACLGYLPHQTLLLLFEACQLQLGNVSGLNRQRPISSPSLFFISLQSSLSLKTEIFLTAFPVLVGFPSPFSQPSFTLSFHGRGHVCSLSKKFSVTQQVIAGAPLLLLQWAHLRLEFEELNESFTSASFTVLLLFTVLHS